MVLVVTSSITHVQAGNLTNKKLRITYVHAVILLYILPFIARITVTATSARNPVILLDSYSLRAVTQFLQVYLKLLQNYVWELTQEASFIRTDVNQSSMILNFILPISNHDCLNRIKLTS